MIIQFVSRGLVSVLLAVAVIGMAAQASTSVRAPTIKEVLSVAEPRSPEMAPDGSAVAYSVRRADWSGNRFDTEIYLARSGRAPVKLTDNPHGSSTSPRWSPDSRWIAFFADRGDGRQIYRVSVDGGDPQKITDWPYAPSDFQWSPDGESMALLLGEAPDAGLSARRAEFGAYTVIGESKPAVNLWLLDIERALAAGGVKPGQQNTLRRLTGGRDFSVSLFSEGALRSFFSFSPDGTKIVLSYAKSLALRDAIASNIGVVDVASGKFTPLVTADEYWDATPVFSPDGRHIAFVRTEIARWLDDRQLMTVPVSGGAPVILPVDSIGARDTQPLLIGWSKEGIDIFFLDGTRQHLYRYYPHIGKNSGKSSGKTSRLTDGPYAVTAASFSNDGSRVALLATEGHSVARVYRMTLGGELRALSPPPATMASWPEHRAEVIRWRSPDDVIVEGVLYSPADMDSAAAAPLIVVLHGGPRAAETPRRLHNRAYPIEQWLASGARVLFPNYRGSAGYGQYFRQLITANIGHAEAIDIISGIDYLIDRGLARANQLAVVGHSWGGFLSAFLATSTNRFKAASVGSAIIDQHINYALSPFAVAKEGYLQSYPWQQPQLWRSTSPISYIDRAGTPTLIQHGDNDTVVPTANAHLLYRGLTDMKVPTRLVIFNNSGHYIDRPKEKLAWMQQNLQWFDDYFW